MSREQKKVIQEKEEKERLEDEHEKQRKQSKYEERKKDRIEKEIIDKKRVEKDRVEKDRVEKERREKEKSKESERKNEEEKEREKKNKKEAQKQSEKEAQTEMGKEELTQRVDKKSIQSKFDIWREREQREAAKHHQTQVSPICPHVFMLSYCASFLIFPFILPSCPTLLPSCPHVFLLALVQMHNTTVACHAPLLLGILLLGLNVKTHDLGTIDAAQQLTSSST